MHKVPALKLNAHGLTNCLLISQLSCIATAAAAAAAAAYWEWHIVEGVATGRASANKQPITARRSIEGCYTADTGLSIDGTRYALTQHY
jgi:hypothetical protein